MSRIGTQPVPVPTGVTVEVGGGRTATVKGPGGTLTMEVRPEIDLEIDGAQVNVSTNGSGSAREARAFHGMTRALLNNMVVGVTKGFEKKLDIVGVGWQAQVKGQVLHLSIGFANVIEMPIPMGVTVEAKGQNITVSGADKQAVGNFASSVRMKRKPEPYNGKGIRYAGEQ
ncbi:MAG: 50S ribosomal protein L6, partial [Planctomycetota bacterium]|nr:50S ribosomal protein L6 [Planctomycetota bacterium]